MVTWSVLGTQCEHAFGWEMRRGVHGDVASMPARVWLGWVGREGWWCMVMWPGAKDQMRARRLVFGWEVRVGVPSDMARC